MPTASQLIAEVERIIQDSSYSQATILGFLNDGLLEVSAWDNLDSNIGLVGKVLLPDLEASATVVTTADPHVPLPADYQKELYRVTFQGQASPVEIMSNMAVFLKSWQHRLDRTGPILEVTIRGQDLFYQPIPVDPTTLTLHYYRKPTLMVDHDPSGADVEDDLADDIPDGIPEQLHRGLLVNYACKEIFNEIEDGIDGQKVQTQQYEARYQIALTKLYQSIKHKSKQTPLVRRPARYF